jgi:CDP-diacylglycerol---glycerol-3-phosphate 3-phosphatidyltransferase
MRAGAHGTPKYMALMMKSSLVGECVRMSFLPFAVASYFTSSANLNKSYFTNRQDRYLHFTSSPAMSNYCFDFLRLFSHLSYRLLPPKTSHTQFALHWSNGHVEPTDFPYVAENALNKFQSSQRQISGPPAGDTFVIPMIQAGYLNVREEEHCIGLLFSHIASMPDAAHSVIDLTSGYFALHQPYQDLLIRSPANGRIVAAGPRVRVIYERYDN